MEGPAQPVFAAAQVESWLEGHAAAAVSGQLAGGWLGKRDQFRPSLQLLRWSLGWKDMLLPLALAGSAGDLKNAANCI